MALEDAVFPHCEVSIFFSLPGRGCSEQSKTGKDYCKKKAINALTPESVSQACHQPIALQNLRA